MTFDARIRASSLRTENARPAPDSRGQPANAEKESLVAKIWGTVHMAAEKYGAAFLLGSKIGGLLTVGSLYVGLRQGIDVSPLLETFGVKEIGTILVIFFRILHMHPTNLYLRRSFMCIFYKLYQSWDNLGNAVGTWAAAVVLSGPLYPFSFCTAIYVGQRAGNARTRFKNL